MKEILKDLSETVPILEIKAPNKLTMKQNIAFLHGMQNSIIML